MNKVVKECPYVKECGGCRGLGEGYEKSLIDKKNRVKDLLKPYCKLSTIHGMEDPFFYRNKVTMTFGMDNKKHPIGGIYAEGSHRIIPVRNCMIEDANASKITETVYSLLQSFKIRVYDERTGYGLLRHVQVRTAHATGEVMVTLVTASPVFPSKQNFCKALRNKHPEITTIIQSINERNTTFVMGTRENVLYGKGFIEDKLLGKTFRISPTSFYQVNSVQTEILYGRAIELAGLTGKELVLDAYCGIGTIGIIASDKAAKVIGAELNKDAVRDAVINAKKNNIKNINFVAEDAGVFMTKLVASGERPDVVLMDPPRTGSSKEFLDSLLKAKPSKVVYVSCGPESLANDLAVLTKGGYTVEVAECVDMFPFTGHVETVALLSKK